MTREQLLQEGVIQTLRAVDSTRATPLLGAVGPLQFEVVQYRLQSEYGAESRLESAPWDVLRWLAPDAPSEALASRLPSGTSLAADAEGRPCLLFPSEWAVSYFRKQNPSVVLSDVPFTSGATSSSAVAV